MPVVSEADPHTQGRGQPELDPSPIKLARIRTYDSEAEETTLPSLNIQLATLPAHSLFWEAFLSIEKPIGQNP